jgi:CheY-like chemotaxis protein
MKPYGGYVVSENGNAASHAAGTPRPLALIADDEDEVRRLVSEVLAEVGFDTMTARDGLELLDLALRHGPQVIVADVMMPRMDGYTAVAHLRGQPETAGIPVIMLTGCMDPVYGQLSAGMGAAAHLTKPFSPTVLGELARDMVGRRPA